MSTELLKGEKLKFERLYPVATIVSQDNDSVRRELAPLTGLIYLLNCLAALHCETVKYNFKWREVRVEGLIEQSYLLFPPTGRISNIFLRNMKLFRST